MKKFKCNFFAKICVGIISFLLLITTLAGFASMIFLTASRAYIDTDSSVMINIKNFWLEQYTDKLLYQLRDGMAKKLLPEKQVFFFTSPSGEHPLLMLNNFYCKISLLNDDGTPGEEIMQFCESQSELSYTASFSKGIYFIYYENNERKTEHFNLYIDAGFVRGAHNDVASASITVMSVLLDLKYTVCVVSLVAFILFLISFILLLSMAGHRSNSEKIHLGFFARVPLDLLLAVVSAVIVFAYAAPIAIIEYEAQAWVIGVSLFALSTLFCIFTMLWLPYSFAARAKSGKWWRNTLIFIFLYLIWKIIRSIFNAIKNAVLKLPLTWRTVITVLLYAGLNFIFGAARRYFMLFLINVLFSAVAVWYTSSLAKLKIASEKLVGGVLSYKTETKGIPHDIKGLAVDLNQMGDGLSRAVEAKLKSERMKSELITNVTHDIKTPLTSIVNYVGLLEQEGLEGKPAEYLEVLSRQSARMKKLIDDLVEASKASSGTLSANLEPMDISVLVGQAAGEYAERFEAKGLILVLSGNESPAMVKADSRLTWRIWDNLLGNICKYAMPGTRVYLSVERRSGMIVTVFRNISEQPLTKSGEELVERFVRGENSRTGEGNGLGLSIASTLAAVQGGSLSVKADGDLFKAEVFLPELK